MRQVRVRWTLIFTAKIRAIGCALGQHIPHDLPIAPVPKPNLHESLYFKSCSKTIIGILLLMLAHCGFAMPDDRAQPIQFHAGSVDLDQQSHRGVYIDDVELDQGTTHIRAAHAITEGNLKNQLVKAILKGNNNAQAHYWTLTAADKPPLHAYADIIYYYPERHIIELIGHARVEQGGDSFSAPKIRYETLHQHVISNSDGNNRTTIIIHPGKKP